MFYALRQKWVEKQRDGSLKDKGVSFHTDCASIDAFVEDVGDENGTVHTMGSPETVRVTPRFYHTIKGTQHGVKKWNLIDR